MLENEYWLGSLVQLGDGEVVGPLKAYGDFYVVKTTAHADGAYFLAPNGEKKMNWYHVWISHGRAYGRDHTGGKNIVGLAEEWSEERVKELL